jgi:hypothetical protein
VSGGDLNREEINNVADLIEVILGDRANDHGFFDTTSGGAMSPPDISAYRASLASAQRKLLALRDGATAGRSLDAHADQAVRFAGYLRDAVTEGDAVKAMAFADVLVTVALDAADAIVLPDDIAVAPGRYERPWALCFPPGTDLLPWYQRQAARGGVSVNSVLIEALARNRAAVNDDADTDEGNNE